MKKPTTTQPYELALQAASMPIDENGPCGNGLIDCMGRLKKLQNWLSEASKGIPCLLFASLHLAIHNYKLSIILPENMPLVGQVQPFTMVTSSEHLLYGALCCSPARCTLGGRG